MRINRLIALVVGLWLMSLCLPADAVVLRFKPGVNSIVKHKVTMSGRTEMTNEMLPQPMRMGLTMVMISRQKVLGRTDQGLKVQTTSSGGTMTMTFEGVEGMEGLGGMGGGKQSQKLPDSKMVAIMDERGRVQQIVSSDVPGASDMPLSNDTLASLSGMTGFPEGDVKANDTWADEMKIPASEGTPEINLSVNSRLLELLTYQGRPCAKIRTSFKGPMSFDLSQMAGKAGSNASGTMEATLQGTFTQYYDYAHSVWVGGEGQMTMNMTMNMSTQGVDTGPMQMKMAMNIKMQMVK